MKILIAAATLLALTTPAFAVGNHDDYDCGNGIIEVTAGMRLTVFVENPTRKGRGEYPKKGSFRLKWDLEKGKIWMNGKACEFITNKMVYQRGCAKGDLDDCEMLKQWDGIHR